MSDRPTLAELDSAVPFASRHIGLRDEDVSTMLGRLGFDSLDALLSSAVPAGIRSTGPLDLPTALSEAQVASRHPRAWLAVVEGNARARRFYEREGWVDTGPLAYEAPHPEGGTVPVPVRRYEKQVR